MSVVVWIGSTLRAQNLRADTTLEKLASLRTVFGEGDGAEVMRFPPGISRAVFEKTGYMKNFPNLAGTVHCFCGDDAGHAEIIAALETGGDWAARQALSDIALTPFRLAVAVTSSPLTGARGSGRNSLRTWVRNSRSAGSRQVSSAPQSRTANS